MTTTLVTLALAAMLSQAAPDPSTQLGAGTPDAHVARAKTAAGTEYQNLFNFLCAVPTPPLKASS